MEFEDLLKQIGDGNRFQIFLIIFLLLPTSFFNVYLEPMFLLTTPDHWCYVPEIEHLPQEQQHLMVRPIIGNKNEFFNSSHNADNNNNDDGGGRKKSSCERYDLNYTLINNVSMFHQYKENRSTPIPTVRCDRWIYDKSLYTETAVTWYNFVCDQDYYVNLILSLSCMGLGILTPFLSNLSDRLGRRKALLVTLIITEMSCLSPLAIKNIYWFIFSRCLASGVLNCYYQLPFVMTQELSNQKYRTRSSCLSAIAYSIGGCSVTLALKLTGNWINFTWFQFCVTAIFILGYKWIPESPQWLISKKLYDKAYDQLVQICKFNGRKVPDDLMESIKSIGDVKKLDQQTDSFIQLLTQPGLRFKTLIITFLFAACVIGYGGIVSNTINMEAQNQLFNYLILSFVDLPALFLCWRLVDSRLGRRWTNVFTMNLCGVMLMLPAFYPTYNENFYTVCTMMAKFGVAGTFMVVYQHASELYPTTLRNQGIGLSATVGSIGGIITPQIIYIAKISEWLPLFIIGAICFLASLAASFLPETLNEYLPQRAKDAAEFGNDQPYFSWAKTNLKQISNNDNTQSKQQPQDVSFKQNSSPLVPQTSTAMDQQPHSAPNNNSIHSNQLEEKF